MRKGTRVDQGAISTGFSNYLDLLRLAAALAVFASHAAYQRFTHGAIVVPTHLAHQAVVVFFVLSGFVISHVAHEREHTLGAYAASRAARIYSVAVPALILTIAIDVALMLTGHGQQIPYYQIAQPWKYLPVFLSFTTDVWFLKIDAFSNAPYWSLCYEVWYYIAFAGIFYLRGRSRIIVVAVAMLVTGPRIWLLAPLWIAGCLLYRLSRRRLLRRQSARALLVATILAAAAQVVFTPDRAIDHWVDAASGGWVVAHLRYSAHAAGDMMTGAIVVLNLLAARHAALDFGRAAAPIVWGASFSFALYLLHYPLLELFAVLLPSPLAVIGAVLLAVWLLGQVTERQKHRLRDWLRVGLVRAA